MIQFWGCTMSEATVNDPALIAETKRKLEELGVKYCFAAYVDVNGVPKAKTVPVDKFEKMAKGSELFTVGAMDGMGLIGPEQDECAAVPDLSTMTVLPWDRRFAWFAADLYYHGEPYANCSRTILKKTVAEAAKQGYVFNLGVETEFYVYRRTEDGIAAVQERRFKGPCPAYDVNQTIQGAVFLDPLVEAMNELGWGVYSFDAEGGNGQFETDFDYADVLTMADRVTFFRLMAKSIAQQLGMVASFMPKPFSTDFRSGAHFNMSLADAKSGKNLFDRDAVGTGVLADKHGIAFPDIGYHFVAGLLDHAQALSAITCPTHNSYKGLLAQGAMPDMSWAPVLRCYGDNNRSAMLRLPMSRPCIENRAPDMATNFYLSAALSLAAGLEGITKQADPGRPFNQNLYQSLGKASAKGVHKVKGGSIHRLPRTLLEALEGFETDPLVVSTFGEEFRDIYLNFKLKEWERSFYTVYAEEREAMLEFL